MIKIPNIAILYRKLRKEFPKARFGIVIRNPRGNIRSIIDRINIPGDRNRIWINEYWERFNEYDGMYEAWATVIDSSWMGIDADQYIEILAARWKKAASIYLQNAESIELIRYEDFCADKAKVIEGLSRRLDLPRKNGIENEVDTQFQPRGSNRGVDWEEFFGTENLTRIESRCVNEMRALGYENFHTLDS